MMTPPRLTAITVPRLGDHGDDVRHIIKEHRALPTGSLRGQLIDGNVHIASQKREQQEGKDITPVDAHFLVGIGENIDFNQDNQRQKEKQREIIRREVQWENNA